MSDPALAPSEPLPGLPPAAPEPPGSPSFLQRVRSRLRRLPPAGEIALVFAICFGPLLVSNVGWLFTPREERVVEITNGPVIALIIQELICLTLAAFVLRSRGWRLADFNAGPTFRRTAAGVALFLLNGALYYGAWYLALALTGGRNIFEAARFEINLSLGLAILLSAVNPIFEESVVIGYLFRVLPERYAFLAIFLSAAIRTGYHAYQGPIALIAILPTGLLFGFAYYRFRQLWPLIVAHAIMDLMALT